MYTHTHANQPQYQKIHTEGELIVRSLYEEGGTRSCARFCSLAGETRPSPHQSKKSRVKSSRVVKKRNNCGPTHWRANQRAPQLFLGSQILFRVACLLLFPGACASLRQSAPLSCQCVKLVIKKERKKTDNPREGWENGTPPPHRDFKERGVVR